MRQQIAVIRDCQNGCEVKHSQIREVDLQNRDSPLLVSGDSAAGGRAAPADHAVDHELVADMPSMPTSKAIWPVCASKQRPANIIGMS
jgi:hypothetical protein